MHESRGLGDVYKRQSSSSSSSVSSIISVPLNAVKLDADNRRFVWLVVKGKAHQQYVSLGDFTESGVIVTSGLKVGDCVITDGSQKVSEGMEVSTGKSPIIQNSKFKTQK